MTNRWILGLLVAAGIFAASAIPRGNIAGKATVIDGDSLEIGTTSIRLHAVDAPEANQYCSKDASRWRCGAEAETKLAALVGDGDIVCSKRDIDQYGRTVAVCRNGQTDLGAALVAAGLALAYRQYGDDYVEEEDEARAARRGLWAGDFTAPWEWRRREQTDNAPDAPAPRPPEPGTRGDCLLKGNINRRGERIYHVPGSPNYPETIIDLTRGERWFCTVAEAENAGWRAPRN